MKEIKIHEAEAGQRMDKFLRRYLPGAGSGFLYRMMRKKNIVLNGKKADGREILKEGDVIRVYFSDETFQKFHRDGARAGETLRSLPVLKQSWILYEDESVLLVNKPAGLLSQKDRKDENSLVEYIRGYLVATGQMTDESSMVYAPGVQNRLDRNTSGLVVSAKTLSAAQVLSEGIRTREVRKYYLALVLGEIPDTRHLEGWLLKDPKINHVQIFSERKDGASRVETILEPLAVSRDEISCTLLRVGLVTGKTHQIRAHLAWDGHPLAGDSKYGEETANRFFRSRYGLRRQFLHSHEMTFPRSTAGRKMPEGIAGKTFFAPLPEDLRSVLDGVGISYDETEERRNESREVLAAREVGQQGACDVK